MGYINLKLDDELYGWIKRLASDRRISVSSYVRTLLVEAMQAHPEYRTTVRTGARLKATDIMDRAKKTKKAEEAEAALRPPKYATFDDREGRRIRIVLDGLMRRIEWLANHEHPAGEVYAKQALEYWRSEDFNKAYFTTMSGLGTVAEDAAPYIPPEGEDFLTVLTPSLTAVELAPQPQTPTPLKRPSNSRGRRLYNRLTSLESRINAQLAPLDQDRADRLLRNIRASLEMLSDPDEYENVEASLAGYEAAFEAGMRAVSGRPLDEDD